MTPQPQYDWHGGMLEARLKFWLSVPNADAMVQKLQAEFAAHMAALSCSQASAEEGGSMPHDS